MVSADSFTAQDEGKIRSGSVPVSGSTELFYRSRITIDELKLRDVPTDFRILSGMPVTVDLKVGKRTALEYLLGRVLPVAMEGMREP
jgi:HlyD family secretion protein